MRHELRYAANFDGIIMLKDIMRVMTSVRMIHIHRRHRPLGMIGDVRGGAAHAAAHVRNVPVTVLYLIVLTTALILEDVVVGVD